MERISLKSFSKEMKEQGGYQLVSHAYNVSCLMQDFATVLGEDASLWQKAGFVHDAGKVLVDSEILNSTRSLSRDEFNKIKSHVLYGEGVIKVLDLTKEEAEAGIACAKYHHAWFNGKHDSDTERGGYYAEMDEKFVSRSAIPTVARACALCDVYEALTAVRSYCDSMDEETALTIIKDGVKKGQFDPKLHKIFVEQVLPKYHASQRQQAQ